MVIVFEFLSSGGVWTQCGSTSDTNPTYLSMRLNQLHKVYKTRVRVRYRNGGLIDLIGYKPQFELEIGYRKYIEWYIDFVKSKDIYLSKIPQANE